MNDLERARAHLLERQDLLAFARLNPWMGFIEKNENAVLAALSWVWEEQEKAIVRDFSWKIEQIVSLRMAEK